MLPSVNELPKLSWNSELNQCFCEVQAPYLRTFSSRLAELGLIISCDVSIVAPALVNIKFQSINGLDTALQLVTASLHHGALQNLLTIKLRSCNVGGGILSRFVYALEGSVFSRRLIVLSFSSCSVDTEGVWAMANLLSRDALPALKELYLPTNPNITDMGIVALAEALVQPTQTLLTHLNLSFVGLRDEGISTLGSVVIQGRLDQLKELDLSRNYGVTNDGVINLARAIDAHGLPTLEFVDFGQGADVISLLGVSAIAYAVIRGVRSKEIELQNLDDDKGKEMEMDLGMMRAAGREDVTVSWLWKESNRWLANETIGEVTVAKETCIKDFHQERKANEKDDWPLVGLPSLFQDTRKF